ncbi:MAG: hypothetical protein Q8P07_01725 [bacterium]|nr:hypothetical protein [bacterium]
MAEKETLEARVSVLEKKHRDYVNALAKSRRKSNSITREFFEPFASFVLDKLESRVVLGETSVAVRYEESCRFGSVVFTLTDWTNALDFLEEIGLVTRKYLIFEAIVSLKTG